MEGETAFLERIIKAREQGRAEIEAELSKVVPPPPGLSKEEIDHVAPRLIAEMEAELVRQTHAAPDKPAALRFFSSSNSRSVTLRLPTAFGGTLWWHDICAWGRKVEAGWDGTVDHTNRLDAFTQQIADTIHDVWAESHPHVSLTVGSATLNMTLFITSAEVEGQGNSKKLKILK